MVILQFGHNCHAHLRGSLNLTTTTTAMWLSSSGHSTLSVLVPHSQKRIILFTSYFVHYLLFIESSHLTPLLHFGFEPGHRQLKHETCDSTHAQPSRCPSQTSSVPKLLSALSDGVVDSTQLSMCLAVLASICGELRFWADRSVPIFIETIGKHRVLIFASLII